MNGITLQPSKFRFAKQEVEFAVSQIGWDDYQLSQNTMSAIRDFPMPSQPTITDIRAWFDLVNQIAPFIANSDLMAPFRDLLKVSESKARKVYWDENLQQIFEKSRSELVQVATKGLAYFDTSKRTAVISDWSKTARGIGFYIAQKHCHCTDENDIFCCSNGWKLVYCNSRFLNSTEADYVPIEGEALGMSWALKKGRMFLLGCKDILVCVDHQPLLKIFNDKSLDKIDNPRLRSLKEKTLEYSFTMKYIKGLKNLAANAFSRYPVNMPDQDDIDDAAETNSIYLAEIHASNNVTSIDIEDIRSAVESDPVYKLLLEKTANGSFAATAHLENTTIREYFNVKDRLGIVDGLLTYSFEDGIPRLVIPVSLRQQVISNLHAANQGASTMLSRARSSVYWPGMDRNITDHSKACTQCRENAPSQPEEPLIMTEVPEYPFQQVAADLFEIDGYFFLVYVDRLTGFPEVGHLSKWHIISTHRLYFARIFSSLNLKSLEIDEWLQKW